MVDAAAPPPPDDRDALAGELALGLLTGPERAQALRLQLADPGFADLVAAWERRLAPLHLDFAGQVAPPEAWTAISMRLDGEGQADGLVRRLKLWRGGAILSGAIAASLAFILLFRAPAPPPTATPQIVQVPAPPAQMAVAQMTGQGSDMLVAARYDATTAQLNLRAENVPQGDLAPELWLIPADGKPRSLGLISANGTTRLAVPRALRIMLDDGVTMAITMEPAASAPHAAPSSAPVAVGKITIL
ncbi:anti-sigma factor [Sphingobium algorifonticola]|uniref:Anti-sigma K factor RskA C-terminal domain-containing protein n=1 Tax=Sphingobium algorifonticola TaxID=2008318 RepID=A0A437J6L5_9SPHN|nr:anti-sigma factor [Sphingobium algorifonticola]RVT40818.1 hypothetical protein ENE74_10090 [Sphingobium algorifonticola]